MADITTIIFDMDGVIIDSEPIHFEMEQQVMQEVGITLSAEEHHTFIGTSSKNMWQNLKERFALQQPLDELLAMGHHRYIKYLKETDIEPIDGVADLIKNSFKEGYQLNLASSATMENINTVLDKFSLTRYFLRKISGAELENSKPHPEIFLKTAEWSGVSTDKCLVIEDSYNGVQAAKAAGMWCVGFNNPSSKNQNLSDADVTIDGFEGLSIGGLLAQLAQS